MGNCKIASSPEEEIATSKDPIKVDDKGGRVYYTPNLIYP
jgi:hypothetical protein